MTADTVEQRLVRSAAVRAVEPLLIARDAALAAGMGHACDYVITCLEPGQMWSPYAWRLDYRPVFGPPPP